MQTTLDAPHSQISSENGGQSQNAYNSTATAHGSSGSGNSNAKGSPQPKGNFSPDALIIFRGKTARALFVTPLRTNRACCSGGLTIVGQDPSGITIGAAKSNSGGNATSADPGKELPQFEDGKLYLLTQATLNKFRTIARRQITRAAQGGAVTTEDTSNGVVVHSRK